MTITRGTVARLRRQIAEHRASLPPTFCILDQEPGETSGAWEARVAETERRFAAVRATGRTAILYAVGDEEPAP